MGDVIITRQDQAFFKLMDYSIYQDDKLISKVSNGSRKILSLKPGTYEFKVKVLGMRSNTFKVNLKARQTVRLTCGSNLSGIKYLFSMFLVFSRKESLVLGETAI